MPFHPDPSKTPHLAMRARNALDFTQAQMGDALGVARRTITRWEAGQSYPSVDDMFEMARAVFEKDPALAAELAAEGGGSLEGIGLAKKVAAAPHAPPAPAGPPPRPFPPVDLMMDSVVHVAVQALAAAKEQEPIAVARAVLTVGFSRARALGITIDEADQALRPRAGKG